MILDSKLGGEAEGPEGREGSGGGGGGGGGGDNCLSVWLGVSLLKLLPRRGFALGAEGLSRVLTAAAADDEEEDEDDDDSGEVLVGGAEEVLVTLCNRDDKPAARHKVKVK